MRVASRYYFELLGGLTLHLRDATEEERILTRFRTRATGALLAYLVSHRGTAHGREKLIEMFWPDETRSIGRNKLSLALSALRRVMNPPGSGLDKVLYADTYTVGLQAELLTTDVELFDRALRMAESASRSDETDKQIDSLTDAVNLYGGELLPHLDNDWIMGDRIRLAERYQGALKSGIYLHERSGNLEAALAWSRRALQSDQYWEEGHHNLIALYLRTGQVEKARRHFLDLKRLLAEIGTIPSKKTEDLVRHLNIPTNKAILEGRPRTRNSRSKAQSRRIDSVTDLLFDQPRVPPHLPSSLPFHQTRFFGRIAEMTELREWIKSDNSQLMLLTGSGGIGKTRIAVEFANSIAQSSTTVYFIPLANIASLEQVSFAIARTLGLPISAGIHPVDQIVAYLTNHGPTLLILDNIEHLINFGDAPHIVAGAPQDVEHRWQFLQNILSHVPSVKCIVTSRIQHSFLSEIVLPLSPFPAPPLTVIERHSIDFKKILEWPVIAMFVDRAQASRSDFQITSRNAATIVELCGLLEGVPLAIELTAARTNELSLSRILSQMRELRLDLLTIRRDQRHRSERHYSLRSVFKWSCDLLPPEIRSFFCKLSIFRGGWTEEVATRVTAERNAPQYLADLCRASLVGGHTHRDNGLTRFSMLEVAREYAEEQLLADSSSAVLTIECMAQRHASWCREVAMEVLSSNHISQLNPEFDNLQAALNWSLLNDFASALPIAAVLWEFCEQRGLLQEGRCWLERALSLPIANSNHAGNIDAVRKLRSRLLCGYGKLCFLQGDFAAASQPLQESLDFGRLADDPKSVATALLYSGILASYQADLEIADQRLQEALKLHRESTDTAGTTATLLNLGIVAGCQGNYELSRARWDEALVLSRKAGDQSQVAYGLCYLGDNLTWQNSLEEASILLDEALTISIGMGFKFTRCYAIIGLARVACLLKQYKKAKDLIDQALPIAQEMSADWGIAFALEAGACAAQGVGANERAAILWGGASGLRKAIGAPLPDAYAQIYQTFKVAAQTCLGDAKYSSVSLHGEILPIRDVIDLARSRI